MSDHTNARLFGEIFRLIIQIKHNGSQLPIEDITRNFWGLYMKGDYDFDTYQMGADEALIELGLARPYTVAEIEEEGGDGIVYYDDSNFLI